MLYPLLLTAYLIIFTLLSWKKPQWAIFIILAALPSYAVRFSLAGIPMTLLEGMILILFTVWGAEKIKLSFRYIAAMNTRVIPRSNATRDPLNQRAIFFPALAPRDSSAASGVRNDAEIFQFLRGKFTLPIFLFLLSATISVFVSPDKRAAIGIWKAYFIEPILFLIVFLDIL